MMKHHILLVKDNNTQFIKSVQKKLGDNYDYTIAKDTGSVFKLINHEGSILCYIGLLPWG